MKKVYLIIFLWCMVVQTASAKSIRDLYQEALPSMVTLYAQKSVLKKGKLVGDNGIGSGVIISEDGKIFTAAHVVDDANIFVEVEFFDGSKGIAEIISSSKISDIALLKLTKPLPKNVKVATLGDSNNANIGDKVIVIGSPYGISKSLSVGYITGKKDNTDEEESIESVEFFQTDAAINQGNSGGAMFNQKGDVIAIISSILTKSGGFEGIGFAVTINSAKQNVLDRMIPWIGINAVIVSGDLSDALNLPQPIGMLIQSVSKGSPADFAGLRGSQIPAIIRNTPFNLGGDVILSIMGITIESVDSAKEITNKLANTKNGDKITLTIFRHGKIQDLSFFRSN